MIHQQLARVRKKRGLTQAQVAEAMDLPQGLISNYEKGARRLHAELIVRFAELYEVSTDELLTGRSADQSKQPDLSLHLVRRMQQIEQLPKNRQKAVLHSLDLLITGASVGQPAACS